MNIIVSDNNIARIRCFITLPPKRNSIFYLPPQVGDRRKGARHSPMPKAPFIRDAGSRRQYGDAAFCPLRPVIFCAVVRERCRFRPRCVPGAGFLTKSCTVLLPSVYYLFCELQGETCVRSTFSVLLCPLFPKIVLRMEKMLIPRRAAPEARRVCKKEQETPRGVSCNAVTWNMRGRGRSRSGHGCSCHPG